MWVTPYRGHSTNGSSRVGERAYFASAQLSPAPTSTARGGSSGYAPTISARTSSLTPVTSVSGTSSKQLVVHLEDEARAPALGAKAVVSADHRHLDHVGGGALHDGVDGQPLAERSRLTVRGAELRDRATSSEQRRHVAVRRGLRDRARDELLHAWEAREVGVDVFLRLLARDLEVLGEPEGRDPVDDPEVDHLRDVALGAGEQRRLLAEHLRCGPRVDVLAPLEGLAKHRLPGDVGKDPKLDLAVVGREQPVPFLGDERRADLPAEVGPDRDRLEVRIRRRQASRRGDGLVERRVEPSVTLRDQRRQRQQIGVEQLRVLAPLLDHRHDLVLGADPAQDAAVGRVARLSLAARLEAELLE